MFNSTNLKQCTRAGWRVCFLGRDFGSVPVIRPVLSFLLAVVYNSLHTYLLMKCLYHSLIQTHTHTHALKCMYLHAHRYIKSLWWNKPGYLNSICCWARKKTKSYNIAVNWHCSNSCNIYEFALYLQRHQRRIMPSILTLHL